MFHNNSKGHLSESSTPFEMIDNDRKQQLLLDGSPPRTRNRNTRRSTRSTTAAAAGNKNPSSTSNGSGGRAGGGGSSSGSRRRRVFDDFVANSSDDDDELLVESGGRTTGFNNDDEFNSSGIDDDDDDNDDNDDEGNDTDIFQPLLTNLTLDFKNFWSQFKSVGPKLVPFFKTLGMYFVIFIPVDRPSWFAMLIKCLPVASLVLFVLLHGISLKDEHSYARKILMGLAFSCLGDALLVWPSYFVEGMTAFGFAQVFYIFAFGFEAENWTLGVIIYAMTSIGLGILMPGLMNAEPALMVGVPIYVILLTTMVWRGMSRIQYFDDLWSWSKICSCFGGMWFAVSDTILGLNKFYVEIPYSQAVIMGTYYMAQFGIALSIINSKGRDRGGDGGGGESPAAANRREEAYNVDHEHDEDGSVYKEHGKRQSNVSWMEILEHTAPHTKTLEISPEEQREAELLYY